MEFEKVFMTLGVCLVAIIAVFSFIGSWNTTYNDNAGNSSSAVYNDVQLLMNTSISALSVQSGNQTITSSGSGSSSTSSDLVSRSLGIITLIPRMLGLIPAIFQDGAYLLGIPEAYVNVAGAVFIFSFAVLFAYLLIIGVRRLV